MRRRIYAVIAVSAALLIAVIAYTIREKPHAFSEAECGRCHYDEDDDPRKLIAPVAVLCGKCHKRGLKTASHPVDMRPASIRIPADMPLTDGKLTCNTCHNVHAKRFTAFGEKSYYLRRPVTGRDFCASCHERDPLSPGHRELMDVAHMARKYKPSGDSDTLDTLSVECIGCHDGLVGRAVDYAFGPGSWEHNFAGPHSIGVHYNERRMSVGGLRPISQINKSIRFFGGKIGCGTCHDPFSKRQALLVMDNKDSRLCSECHFDK